MLHALRMDFETSAETFFREFYPRLYQAVQSHTGAPRAEVEEIVQEVLLHAWRDREKFRHEASPLTWLMAIARNRTFERRRSRDRKARAEEVLRALRRMDTELVPQDVLERGDVHARVRRALERVGKPYAQVLTLRYLEDRGVPDIARELGESEKAIESRLHRAREAFRTELTSGDDDE